MLLVEPVVVRPLLVEWEAEKDAISVELERAAAAKVQRRADETAERGRAPAAGIS